MFIIIRNTQRHVLNKTASSDTHYWKRYVWRLSIITVIVQIVSCITALVISWHVMSCQKLRVFLFVFLSYQAFTFIYYFGVQQVSADLTHQGRNNSFLNVTHAHSPIKIWVHKLKYVFDFIAVIWFIIGNYLLFTKSSLCSMTACWPLYYASLGLIVCGYFLLCLVALSCTCVILILPCILGTRSAFVGLRMRYNKYRNLEATAGPPKAEQIEADSTELSKIPGYCYYADPEKESEVCTICLTAYEEYDNLCRLKCQHQFHRTCLHTWLAINFICPNCKQKAYTI